MSSVAVTGGAGWIGSVTTQALINAGHRVIVIDNLSTGHREAVSSKAQFFALDLSDQIKLNNLFQTEKVSAVVHFAAKSVVPESVANPELYYRNNVEGTLNLLRAMKLSGVEKLVFSSTAATYGIPVGELNESHSTNPINPYGHTKLAIEWLIRDWASAGNSSINYKLKAFALRYFNAAGASIDGTLGEDHSPETHLIPRVLKHCLGTLGEPLTVYGTDYETADGTCVRDYIHVEDLASAHVLALKALEAAPLGFFQALNIGTGKGHSVREVLTCAEKVTGKLPVVTYGPRRTGDPAILVASVREAGRALGWKAQYSELEKIMGDALRWLKAHPSGYR